MNIQDLYHYSLNGVFHTIQNQDQNIFIDQKLLSELDEKVLLSQKYLLKYIHDLFDYHHIDYSIYFKTLLGFQLFQGIHIFHHQIELVMMYRNFEDLYKELKNDGFQIDFESKYLMVISSSFFDKIQIKVFIYFLHMHEDNTLYHLSPSFVENSKTYKELLQQKEEFHLTFIPFQNIFPCKKENYEDFQIYVPNKINPILQSLHLIQDKYTFDHNNIKKLLFKKNNNIEDKNNHQNNHSNNNDINQYNLSSFISFFTNR